MYWVKIWPITSLRAAVTVSEISSAFINWSRMW
jgi:hypothetical protein